jgi:hypothetical protein
MSGGAAAMAAGMATPTFSSPVVAYLQSFQLVQPPPPPPPPPAPPSSDPLVNAWNGFTGFVGDAVDWVGNQFSSAANSVQNAFNSAVTFVTNLPQTISNALDSFWTNTLAPWICSWDSVLGNVHNGWFAQVSNFCAGMGDTISCGLTRYIRRGLGYDDVVDYNSNAYRYGTYAGEVVNIGLTLVNPAGAARWAVTGLRIINGLSRLGGAIGAAEAALNGDPTQAALLALGALGTGARGAGPACSVTQTVSRLALRASQAAGFAQGAIQAYQRYQEGDTLGAFLSLAQMGASAYRLRQSCFTAEMLVDTENGKKRADKIVMGDRLWSRSQFDPCGPIELREVEEVFVLVSPIINLHVAGQIIRTTREHPFYVEGRGWVPAANLTAGDLLSTRDGGLLPVEGVADSGQVETVYNWRIAEYHTYFVAARDPGASVWAHNNDYPNSPTGRGSVPPGQRDPKRVWTRSENQARLAGQEGRCASCGQPINIDNGRGHHRTRHADGGRTNAANHDVLCVDCHKKVHKP